jgi:hypothetical protein
MIRIPREFFKTSCFTRGASLWVLSALDVNATIGIFNEKEDNPQSWIAAICDVIESSYLYQTLYRDILPKGIGYWDKEKGVSSSRKLKWGGTGMMLERDTRGVSELSLEPHGISGTAVGKHFTHKILDDIIGLNASRSQAVMQAAIEWADNARALERPLEGGCELINHTTWAYYDVYKHMETKWPGEYKIFQRALLENPSTGEPDADFGQSIFPEKISTAKAYQMRNADPFVFSAQYQCVPQAGKNQSFATEWDGHFYVDQLDGEPCIKITKTGGRSGFDSTIFDTDSGDDWAPEWVPLYLCERAIILDPAPSKPSELRKERLAKNGIVVVAKDPWGRRFNLESLSSREGPTDILRRCVHLYWKWKINKIAIEEVNFSAVYAPLWEEILRLDPAYENVHPEWMITLPEGRDKDQRIREDLIPIHENFLWYYNMGDPNSSIAPPSATVLKEKKEFPHGSTKDTLDAQAYTDSILTRPETPDELHSRRLKQRHEYRGVTGYGF